jgi:hypothetical protein
VIQKAGCEVGQRVAELTGSRDPLTPAKRGGGERAEDGIRASAMPTRRKSKATNSASTSL